MKEKGGEKRLNKRESKEITMKERRTVVLGSADAAQDSWELECLIRLCLPLMCLI